MSRVPMKVTLHDRQHTIAQATGDSLRRALNELADKPGVARYALDESKLESLVVEFEPNLDGEA